MSGYDYDIGIIGGGSAGLTIAAGAAQLGAKTLLLEKEPVLGGDCLHYGCVPSKTLIRTAEVYHLMKNAERFGLPAVTVGPVDFAKVSERIRAVIAAIQPVDSPERFCKLGAAVEFGQAAFVDEHTVDTGSKRVTAKTWAVCTGSEPGIPPIPGLAETPHLTNTSIFYMNTLPKSLAILGGGPIAVEMAQAFARLGSDVHVIQRSGQILSKEDKDMADMAMRVLEAEGVTFHLGSAVSQVADKSTHREVTVNTGETETTLRVEAILLALGRSLDNLNGLKLANAGVEYGPKGIPVDGKMKTSQSHIYAAGDCTGKYQFTHAAGYEGGVVVSNAVIHFPKKADYTWMPWCTYCQPELASIGYNQARAEAAGLNVEVVTEEFHHNDRALAEGETVGKIKLLLARGKPVGVQILGPDAGELLGEWSAALTTGAKLTSLAGAVHAYPTLAEINKRVVGNHVGKKLFSDFTRKTLKLLFNYRGRACGSAAENGG